MNDWVTWAVIIAAIPVIYKILHLIREVAKTLLWVFASVLGGAAAIKYGYKWVVKPACRWIGKTCRRYCEWYDCHYAYRENACRIYPDSPFTWMWNRDVEYYINTNNLYQNGK